MNIWLRHDPTGNRHVPTPINELICVDNLIEIILYSFHKYQFTLSKKQNDADFCSPFAGLVYSVLGDKMFNPREFPLQACGPGLALSDRLLFLNIAEFAHTGSKQYDN